MEGANNSQFPGFFKVYLPNSSSQRMKLPPAFVQRSPKSSIPKKLYLRNRHGERWAVILGSVGNDLFFQGVGWIQFVRDNNLVEGNFLVFYFNGIDTFDFKILGLNGCEKIDDEDEVVEEINEDGYKDDYAEEEEDRVKEAEEDNDDEDCANTTEVMQVKEVEEEEEEKEKEAEDGNDNEAYANPPEVMQVKDEEEEEKDEAEEVNDNEDYANTPEAMEEEKIGKRKRKEKGKAKQEKFDIYGADIFKSGTYRQPANPYFVTKRRQCRKDALYIPVDVVKDLQYELPKTLNVGDPRGNTHPLQLNTWTDGRIWYRDGWRRLCDRNCIGEEDRIICEFIQRGEQQIVEMQIHIVRAGNSSN